MVRSRTGTSAQKRSKCFHPELLLHISPPEESILIFAVLLEANASAIDNSTSRTALSKGSFVPATCSQTTLNPSPAPNLMSTSPSR